MAGEFDIQIDAKKTDALLKGLSNAAMLQAWRRTLRKTAVWLKAKAAREINKSSKFAITVIKARLRYFQRAADEGKLWGGLNPISSFRLGRATATASGAKVGKYSFPKAWVMKTKPNRGAWMRASKDRFPVVQQTVAWDAAASAALLALVPEVEGRLLAVLEHEISYELSKVGL